MFLPLLLAIWLFLVLASLAVSDRGLYLLQACVSALLKDQFSLEGFGYGELWGKGSAPGVQTETGRILFLDVIWFLCPDGSRQVTLGSGI